MIRASFLAGTIVLVTLALAAVPGCSSESASGNRTSAPPTPSDGGADADGAAVPPDPAGGRDDSPASCYAACQNGGLTCQSKGDSSAILTTVELSPEPGGCAGTLTTGSTTPTEQSVAIKIDCKTVTICKGDAPGQPATTCVPGTFSAFSFAYSPAGGAQSVCTRN